MDYSQITSWYHHIIRSTVDEGGNYIDATMGKGMDTKLLCELAGEKGSVLAFDIQEQAIAYTGELLKKHGLADRARLILDGHEHMDEYAAADSIDLICFNFGYLPGGDHQISTRYDTSVKGIDAGCSLLKPGGLMCLCIYSGGDTGFEEKEKVLEYLKQLPAKQYTVIVNEYYNRENNPPMPVFVWKRR